MESNMVADISPPINNVTPASNGIHNNGSIELNIEEHERELPFVDDGQIPLGELLSRVMQSIYAELSELAETMPNMSDSARKRTMADWVVKTKKQVVKLYAVAKWARDAGTVQKCMNITAFLMNQNQQFADVLRSLEAIRDAMAPARLRNHDLLTSLDVLTTGSYRRLPTIIKKSIIPPRPLTDAEVLKTLTDMEDVMRYRLRLTEIIPVEMSHYRISNGRVYFTAPKLFETSICLRGAEKDDGWFFVHVEFLITVGGDATGIQEFPRIPTGIMKRHLTDEADSRLAFYLPMPEQPPGVELPPRPVLPEGVVDTPLVRLYNFLQIMSLSYQLEILWYQAERMQFLSVNMTPDRKIMTVTYWRRKSMPNIGVRHRTIRIPEIGGKLIIAIVEARGSVQAGGGPERSSKARGLADLQRKSKLGAKQPSDDVEGLRFKVTWEPEQGALGVQIPPEELILPPEMLAINADDLDFESLLLKVIQRHVNSIISMIQLNLQRGPSRAVFGAPGVVTLDEEDNARGLRVRLCADEIVIITIDPRTGRLNLRDTGDLAAAGRGPRFFAISEKINENPSMLMDALVRLRLQTIVDLAEQMAKYLGLQSFRSRNFHPEERRKLGPAARGTLYIQLEHFPDHYLVIIITDDNFQYALIESKVLRESMFANLIMDDIGWLDFDRIHGEDVIRPDVEVRAGMKRKRSIDDGLSVPHTEADRKGFNLDTQVLRELYSYCCARVAYTNIERQFKLRKIHFTHVTPSTSANPLATELQSSLVRSVPSLCVQSKHILAGAPAAEAAMPNIRVIPLNWWSDSESGKGAQVVTCVKLKYVYVSKSGEGTSSIIRPSKRIIYDTTEAIVSFLSENVNTCVDEFLEEWARVSKMVVIAREVAQLKGRKGWEDVRLLDFDLQTAVFAYKGDYTVSITCEDQLKPTGGTFELRFGRMGNVEGGRNPHTEAEPFLRTVLHAGKLGPSVHQLVMLLRDTLPIVVELSEFTGVDSFAKSAGWYRVLYRSHHALDFRLMTERRVAILDGSHSLFSFPSSTTSVNDAQLGLKPIPNFAQIISELPGPGKRLDVGIVCRVDEVSGLAREVHDRVIKQLEGSR
ncbi:mediator complex subunit MED14-domain-containing protein [Desarmillaria tabescens]|uniref:Mediator of RNA polymerase II transcription subunit 14 n=1 Tax=Armillaria tabescens TaxID=1929756 RepID=A0AA39TVQ1_ARMTA|nr:mediator complex subunit MED14-domain-containing protein [Desarmillaria tabescens]KAK0461040.1 mediator complex subunit MED14-domain-containing protein [Desarmillaria tabescens]